MKWVADRTDKVMANLGGRGVAIPGLTEKAAWRFDKKLYQALEAMLVHVMVELHKPQRDGVWRRRQS